MPRKQRFKPSRKPKQPIEENAPIGTQAAPPGHQAAPPGPRIPKEREREAVSTDRNDVVIDHDRPR
jgi:hypothetical protein